MVWPSVVILTVARIEQPSTRQDTTRARSWLDKRFILTIILERSSIVKGHLEGLTACLGRCSIITTLGKERCVPIQEKCSYFDECCLLEEPTVVSFLQQECQAVSAPRFGELFKRLRIESGQTLRAFCLKHAYDPGNVSKIERGRSAPPASRQKLTKYAKALGLAKGSPEWQEFFDVADAEKGRIPDDLLTDADLVAKLPVLFRTLRGGRADGDALEKLVEKIRRA